MEGHILQKFGACLVSLCQIYYLLLLSSFLESKKTKASQSYNVKGYMSNQVLMPKGELRNN